MELSNNIVSEFVKMTNDSSSKKTNQSSIYGTVVIYNDNQYVQLDGSELLTPADSTVHVKNGERVTVSINNHTAIINGNITDISASDTELKEVHNELVNFEITTEGMFLEVKDDMNQRFAEVKVTTDEIKASVSEKIGGTEVGTIVTQNAESWGLSINGKLSGTNYRFDGNNFTIGSSDGSTTAYHAAGYSKWTHSDGSWTKISANGMTWSKGPTTTGYHYLLYAGEYVCNSEETVTITLPDEFKGKEFKVVTSIKRIYISNDEYITGCYFPLLSFYAEATNINRANGTFQIYASIRAWNRTGYGGWGQLIGNGTTAGEREALKPVVAYWAFV